MLAVAQPAGRAIFAIFFTKLRRLAQTAGEKLLNRFSHQLVATPVYELQREASRMRNAFVIARQQLKEIAAVGDAIQDHGHSFRVFIRFGTGMGMQHGRGVAK